MKRHEYPPFKIPSGSTLPINFYVAGMGKWPIITPYQKKEHSRLLTPSVQCEAFQDEKGFVYMIQVTPAPTETNVTDFDIEVNIYPQNVK